MFEQPLFIIIAIFSIVALAEWLSDKSYFRHAGTGLMVIIFGAVLSNIGIIPASSPATPVYDAVFTYIAPLSIFFILLSVNLTSIQKAGKPMLAMFTIGALATTFGALISMWLLNGHKEIGDMYYAIGGMYTGTYIGGGLNFNAVALNYGVNQDGNLYSAATVADNILSALWVIVTLAIPKFLNKRFSNQKRILYQKEENLTLSQYHEDSEKVGPLQICFLVTIGLTGVFVSQHLHDLLPTVPSILILTTIALLLAQISFIHKMNGHKLLGLIGVYLFLTVIGAYCDIYALISNGRLALILLIMVTMLVVIHGILIYGIGAYLKEDWDVISIASQANIGGTATALALARSLDRNDLVLPGILVGALGNGLGSYIGIFVAEFMRTSIWFI